MKRTLFTVLLVVLMGVQVFAVPKIAFLYSGPVGDFGWTYAQDQARLSLPYETTAVENVAMADVENVLTQLIAEGYTMFFCTSWEQLEPVQRVAAVYPDVKFFVARIEGEPSANVWLYLGRMYQVRYIAGIIAGSKTKTNIIGYVAAFPIPEVIRGINAFARGVAAVNPKAKVVVRWTQSWYSPVDATEAAASLISDGADVLAQHVQGPSVQQVAEEEGVYSIGYNTDMSKFAPHANLTNCVWNWSSLYQWLIFEALLGHQGRRVWASKETGTVGLSPFPPDLRALVMSHEHDEVFPGLTDDQLMAMESFDRNVEAP